MLKNLKMKFLSSIALTFCFYFSNGQTSNLISQLEIGAVRGIQLSKNFPILKSGSIANIKVSKELSPYVQIGAGVGYISLEFENFTPFYAYIKGNRKNTSRGYFFEMSIGKSRGENANFNNSLTTNFKGGTYFSPGIGYQYEINEKWSFSSSINYVMQKTELNQLDSQQEIFHTEKINIDLLVFKIGLIIK